MLSRSQLLNGPLLQVYLWTKYFILIKSVNLCAQKKPEKKSDFVIDRKCLWCNKSKIEEMEDQVLI